MERFYMIVCPQTRLLDIIRIFKSIEPIASPCELGNTPQCAKPIGGARWVGRVGWSGSTGWLAPKHRFQTSSCYVSPLNPPPALGESHNPPVAAPTYVVAPVMSRMVREGGLEQF